MNQLPRLEELPELFSKELLSGKNGSNRDFEKKILINAENDLQAVQAWLNEYSHKETTYKSYRKESERLLLWCVLQANKPLSSLDRNDFENYFLFLDDPQPKDLWCKKKGGYGVRRGQSNWKPFQSGLSQSAKNTAISIIKSLMGYLYESRYLDSNPLVLMRKSKQRHTTIEEHKLNVYERMLCDDEWQAIIDTMNEWPDNDAHQRAAKLRLQLIVGLLYFLGLRVNDISTSKWNAFRKIQDNWWFFVRGKGDKLAKIPVNSTLLKIIIDYRVHFDMTVYPHSDDEAPLLFSFTNKYKPIGNRQVNYVIKKLAKQAGKRFPDQISKQRKIEKLSPHWFRHQSASMQARAGIPAEQIRENLRHASYQTTMVYVHCADEERHKKLEQIGFKLNNISI